MTEEAQTPSPSDEGLWTAFQSGDRDAFRKLVARHEAPLRAYLTALCGDRATSEDAFQETFLRLIRAREQFSGNRWSGWLFTTARNAARTLLKRRARERRLGLSLLRELRERRPAQPDPTKGNEVRLALARLPDQSRQVLALKIDCGWTYARIAEHLEVPPRTVGSWAFEGMKQLRSLLKD